MLALAGGVGGAKLALGLARLLPPEALDIVVNTGDDTEMHGLHVSPDLDTVMYTLAGLANPATGWGIEGDSFRTLEALGRLGSDTWFGIGDIDLATHLRRTELLRAGRTLSEVTRELCDRLGVRHRVVPMSDDRVRTLVTLAEGETSFQDYFVRLRSEPAVLCLRFEGAEQASPAPAFREALAAATAVIVCPSNPFLSIDPILTVAGVRDALSRVTGRPLAVVSPIIAGEAVKGPAARLFRELRGLAASATAVAQHYAGLATHFVLDERDGAAAGAIAALGYEVVLAQTLMTSEADKVDLAAAVCRSLGLKLP